MKLVLATQRYLLRRRGTLAARKVSQVKVKNSKGQLISKIYKKERGRPRETNKMHRHNTKRLEDVDKNIALERRVCATQDV